MGSLFGGDAPSVPKPVDIFAKGKKGGPSVVQKQLTGTTGYYGQALPAFLGLQGQYTPQFMEQAFGFGGQALTGLQALQQTAGAGAAQSMANLRAQELGLMTGQAGTTRGLMEALSPEQAAAVAQANRTAMQAQGLESDLMGRAGGMMGQYGSQVGQYGTTLGDISGYAGPTISSAQAQERTGGTLGGINPYAGPTISEAQAQELAGGTLGGISPYVGETISGANADVARATQMAQEAFERRGALSPEEQRAAQQQAREAGQAAGRLGGNAAIAAEIQNREAAKAARRGEAAQLGQQAFQQQLGAAGQRLASEQALYGQRGANVERDIALQQARFGQGLGALQQRLATQQARYGQLGAETERSIALQQARFGQDIAGREQQLAAQQARYAQLGSEQERELARRQNLFQQGITGGAQRAQERQLGFAQLMDIENQRGRLREEAAQAGQRSYGMAGGFYTQPGLGLLSATPASYGAGTSLAGTALGLGQTLGPELDYNLPLNLARERAGALDQANLAQYQADMQARQSRAGMIGNLVGLAAIPFTGGLSAGLGLTGLAGGAAGATGLSGLGLSAGMGLSNMFGGIPRATPV
jgi:hypothetical protein